MKICVYGLWHLGSVTAACLADRGHLVTGYDKNKSFVDSLSRGQAPIFEPELDSMIQKGLKSGNLKFTTEQTGAVHEADVVWVTFDTPVDDDDVADTAFVLNAIQEILPALRDGCLVVISSQLPVGSIGLLRSESADAKRLLFACSPENLRLGNAVKIFLSPDRIIVGVNDDASRVAAASLFGSISDRLVWMSIESAEMTKHAINSFLALSVCFANEIATLCEIVGADANEVAAGLKSESRIGPKAYLSPGPAFGGGTLARDVEFLGALSNEANSKTPLLCSVKESNDTHRDWEKGKISEYIPKLSGCKVAVLGLTYKPGTDTLRRSRAINLCEWLLDQGATVSAHDPLVKKLPKHLAGKIALRTSVSEAMSNAEVVVIGNDSKCYREAASDIVSTLSSGALLIDAGRALDLAGNRADIKYLSVGRNPENE